MLGPGGAVEKLPETVEAKMTSAVRALVRTSAEKNGYNIAVIEAMIDRTKEVQIDGEVINEKGQILTLTNVQAEREYGTPPKPLLSSGTVDSIDELLAKVGLTGARVTRVSPTGAEQIATFLTTIGPLLLLAGIIGVYIEMKTPGFGLPGIIGAVSFALYFLGGYVAGLSGLEWTVVFYHWPELVRARIVCVSRNAHPRFARRRHDARGARDGDGRFLSRNACDSIVRPGAAIAHERFDGMRRRDGSDDFA
jgi:membrane-bound serine protease (ClpP class)